MARGGKKSAGGAKAASKAKPAAAPSRAKSPPPAPIPDILARWRAAGSVWTGDLRLSPPTVVYEQAEAKRLNAAETLACINPLTFQTILNLNYMNQRGVLEFLDVFMAHEIGHHALAPAGFTNQIKYIVAGSVACGVERAPELINLATDFLINDLLVRRDGMPCDAIYRQLTASDPLPEGPFMVMLLAMERLWRGAPLFPRTSGAPSPRMGMLADALVAVYALHGEGRRGAELIPYVALACAVLNAAGGSGGGGEGSGGGAWDRVTLGPGDAEAMRRWLRGGNTLAVQGAVQQAERALKGLPRGILPGGGRLWGADYTPRLLQAIGQGAGLPVTADEIVIAHYETLANGHLVTFEAEHGGHNEGHPESLREWSWGEPLEEVDWLQTAIREGQPIPGVNTVAWELGYEPEPMGAEPFPIDLDLYVDTSGSMPDPHNTFSHIALGAFIFALSVLRQGGAVRATIWSQDMQNLVSTGGFSTDREEVLKVLCVSIQGGTQFPVKHWEEVFGARRGRVNHIYTAILSDDGIDTWFHGSYKTEHVEGVLARVQSEFQAGGAVLLNGRAESVRHPLPENWVVRGCQTWDDVVQACVEIASRRFKLNR